MTKALDAAAAALTAKFAGSDFDATVVFEIEGEGSIRVEGEAVAIGSGPADVTISASLDTFREIFEGELGAPAAYMTGRLKVEGDLGIAMRLGQVLG